MKILVKGPALTRTGYGEHCRFVLRALRQDENLDIYLSPTPWGQSSWIWRDDEERRWMDKLVRKTARYEQQKGNYDVSFQVTIPNEWESLAPVNIGVTAGIETTMVAPVWLQKAQTMDKIITISEHSKDSFAKTVYEAVDQRTGQKQILALPRVPSGESLIEVVHYPIKKYENLDLNIQMKTKFNFLTVAQWGPRKNIKKTIRWFVEEFYDNPDVGLVVKTFVRGGSQLDREHVHKKIKYKILNKYKDMKCKIYLLHGDLSEQEMHSLYTHKNIHCLISLTHGEGFGLPLFEAAYSGLPVLATDWSGHLDFLYKPVKDKKGKEKLRPHFAKVEYELKEVQKAAVWDGVIQANSMWAYPQQGSYKMKLREVYKNHGRFKSQAKKLQKWILENFTEEQQYKKINNILAPYLAISLSDDEIDDIFSQM